MNTTVNTGAWSERIVPNSDDLIFKIFEQSVGQLIGVKYTLVAYYQQVVNGMNYCFEVESKVVAPGAVKETKWAYIHVSIDGVISPVPVEFKDHPPH